jgi:integrase
VDREIVVHSVRSPAPGVKVGDKAIFAYPEMRLLEEPTSYLRHLAQRSILPNTLRNNAYALAYWINFCDAANIDCEHADVEELIDYRTVLQSTESTQTGRIRTASTVAQYLGAVVDFYDHKFRRGTYNGTIRKSDAPRPSRTLDNDALAHIHRGPRMKYLKSPVPIKNPQFGTMIKPLSIPSLRRLLEAIGPTASDAAPEASVRNRLIADWAWAVGLRISEILHLQHLQFRKIKPRENAPWAHVPIEVLGKGNKRRRVAVPNWLINDTQLYIDRQRSSCVKASKFHSDFDALFVGDIDSPRPGYPIGPRRVEAIFSKTFLEIGCCKVVEVHEETSSSKALRTIPTHCFHDLRHTYAVLTYHAEVQQGNAEPWKKIQAQLGHASMTTTVDVYLQYVNGHNDFRHASLRDLIGLRRQ